MSSRTYDVKIKVDRKTSSGESESDKNGRVNKFFEIADVGYIVGEHPAHPRDPIGLITATDKPYIYVKLANTLIDVKENINLYIGNIALSNNAVEGSNVQDDTSNVKPFNPRYVTAVEGPQRVIVDEVEYNKLFKEKNIFEQTPIVRLYSVYYPGEWYESGRLNPSNDGKGHAWPHPFPLHFCETISDEGFGPLDENYSVLHNGIEYVPTPVSPGNISEASDGKINDVSISIFNDGNFISDLIDNPYLGGYCNTGSNTGTAYINGEIVDGIDIRTRPEAIDSDVKDRYGKANATMTKIEADASGAPWVSVKDDSRDLLGGVVTIKSTFAKFLDYWPEYSLINSISPTSNTITVKNSYVYRVGDNVVSNNSPSYEVKITSIENNDITISSNNSNISNAFFANATSDDRGRLYIVNPDADPESYVEEIFKINQLESLNDDVATFNLTTWLQYFTHVIPKRKYYTNTCGFKYKDERCGYPGPGGHLIPGTSNTFSNMSNVDINNNTGATVTSDVCAKNLEACRLRNNGHRFGGFISVRR